MKHNAYASLYSAVFLAASIALSCGTGKVDFEEFRPIVRGNPNNADEYFNLGTALSILERDDDAVSAFLEAVLLDSTDHEAYFGLGLSLSKLGREHEATNAFDKALSHGKPETTHFNLGTAYAAVGRHDEAIAEFERSLRANEPHPATACFRLGLSYMNTGRYQESLKMFDQALTLNKVAAATYFNVYFYAGINLQVLGHTDQALEAYETSIRYRPDFPYAFLNIGVLHADRGDFETSRKQYEILIGLDSVLAAKLAEYISSKQTSGRFP